MLCRLAPWSAALLGLLAGCSGSPAGLDCSKLCSRDGTCGANLLCQAGYCVEPGQDARRCPALSAGASTASGAASTASSSSGASSTSGSGTSGASSGTSGGSSGTASSTSTGSTGASTTGGSTGSCSSSYGNGGIQTSPACDPAAARASRGEWPHWSEPDDTSSCSGSSCPGDGRDTDYGSPVTRFCTDGVLSNGSISATFVRDSVTQLAWYDRNGSSVTNAQAEQLCQSWTGGSGAVRLPTTAELFSVLDVSPAAAARDGGFGLTRPGLDFNDTINWSSTAAGTNRRWLIDFPDGKFWVEDLSADPNKLADVHCVEEASSVGTETVTDACTAVAGGQACKLLVNGSSPTGLTYFIAAGAPPQLTWDEALAYCDTLGPGCGSWRLPSYKELGALVNWTTSPTNTFVDGLSGDYWSSTPAVYPSGVSGEAMEIGFTQVDGASVAAPDSYGTSVPITDALQALCVH